MAVHRYTVRVRIRVSWWLPAYLHALAVALRIALWLGMEITDATRDAILVHVDKLIARSVAVATPLN